MAATAPPPDRPLIDRLGVKPGFRVGLVGYEDADFTALLADRGAVVEQPEADGLDLLFYRVRRPADLLGLSELRPRIRESGAIWVLREKGAARTVSDVDVIEAARASDLVDNKIVSFSHTLAAMRLVVPLRLRGGRA
jgi:hypothetical protein